MQAVLHKACFPQNHSKLNLCNQIKKKRYAKPEFPAQALKMKLLFLM
jgi:hypothetical protein